MKPKDLITIARVDNGYIIKFMPKGEWQTKGGNPDEDQYSMVSIAKNLDEITRILAVEPFCLQDEPREDCAKICQEEENL